MRVLFLHRDHATVRDLAYRVLELDGCVMDMEIVMQPFLHITQNALAGRGWNICDGNVTRERGSF